MHLKYLRLWSKFLMPMVYLHSSIGWRWYRLRFILLEAPSLDSLSIGKGTYFYVPVRIAGGRGQLTIGARNKFGVAMSHRIGSGEVLLQPRSPDSRIVIGDGNWFNNSTVIIANELVSLGNSCQIGDSVLIYDCDFHAINPDARLHSAGQTKPVTIGDNVFLGSRVIVLKGVTIGDNSVVEAMSLVTNNIPANSVAAGVPAKVIRSISEID